MNTIRLRLTRKLMLGAALLLAVGGLAVYLSTRAALLKEFDATLRAQALAITTLTHRESEGIRVDFSDRFMRGFDEHVATDFFEMWDANGVSLERSESLDESDLPNRFGTLRQPAFWNLTLPSGFAGRAVGFSFSPEMSEDGEQSASATDKVILVVASDRRDLDKMLATLALVLTASGILLLGVTVLLVPRLLRKALVPLDQLAEQASRINADSLTARFPTDALPGELMPISTRLNDLLARLEQSFERERRFSGDLAHELRTPIAELRSLLEYSIEWPEAREPTADREALAITEQLEGIVTRLLALLRSERGQMAITRERIALKLLVENAWRPFVEKAKSKNLGVTLNVPDDAEIETDPTLLRSILTNLVDNAVEYTPSAGTLRIYSGVGSGQFTLRVTNRVEHLMPEDVPKLFDRFWRKDPARSGNERSGLGLSLSRAFAQALGYELTAALDGESELILTLSGPSVIAATTPIDSGATVTSR